MTIAPRAPWQSVYGLSDAMGPQGVIMAWNGGAVVGDATCHVWVGCPEAQQSGTLLMCWESSAKCAGGRVQVT